MTRWRLILVISALITSACRDTADKDPLPAVTAGSEGKAVVDTTGTRRFATYEEAVRFARSNYDCEDDDTSNSSFIRTAEFCETRGGLGYLIVNLNGREYIHEGVPSTVWADFKAASSKGQFYNSSLRGRYRLELEN